MFTIPVVFNPKVNLIARLEFELTFYYVVDQYVSHYTTRTSPIYFFLERKHKSKSCFPSFLKKEHDALNFPIFYI